MQLLEEAGRVVGKSKPSDERDLFGGNQVIEEVFHLTQVPFDKPGLMNSSCSGTMPSWKVGRRIFAFCQEVSHDAGKT